MAIFLPVCLFSQAEYRIGYNAGFFLRPNRHIQILSHQINYAYPDASNKLYLLPLIRGLEFEFSLGKHYSLELHWGNKHTADKAVFVGNDQKTYIQKLKLRYNTFGFGLATPVKHNKRYGLMNDYGWISVHQKFSEQSVFSAEKWKNFNLDRKHGFSMGMNIYMDYFLSNTKKSAVILRPYFQWMSSFTNPYEDNVTQNYYPVSNIGLCLIYCSKTK